MKVRCNNCMAIFDETDTVAMMRGGTVVRLGKAEAVTFSKRGVTIRVKDSVNMTFRRN